MIFFVKTKSGSYRIEADSFKEAEAAALYDVTIGGHKDW